MGRFGGKRPSSASSFGTPIEKRLSLLAAQQHDTATNYSTVSSMSEDTTILKGKKRTRPRKRLSCFCIFVILVVSLQLLTIGLFVLAELLSRPGYDKSTQDTVSNATRERIQASRKSMPSVARRLKYGNSTVTKQELIDYIQLATAYSAASYTATVTPQACNNPVWATLIRPVSSRLAKAYIARDDIANLVVVAFKGMTGPQDFSTGMKTKLVSMTGMNTTRGATVQDGIQRAYQSIEEELLASIHTTVDQAGANHTILVTGHNIGGSMAVLASLAIKQSLPNATVHVVTQGQSKTFNAIAADYIDSIFPGYTMVRAVHTEDGMVTAGAPFVNKDARHHKGEVWQFKDPAILENVRICQGQEDASCAVSNRAKSVQVFPPALPWSAQSMHYFDVELGSLKSVQCGGPGGQLQYSLLTSRQLLKDTPPP